MKLTKTRPSRFGFIQRVAPQKAEILRMFKDQRAIRWFTPVVLCLAAIAFADISHADENVTLPAKAKPMSGIELYMLYRDKSWAWADGAGRFDNAGRRFTASTGQGTTMAWAQGRWIVTDDGRLCLRAEWHSVSGVHPDTTCFSHQRAGETIYQKKEPSGFWYVFRHAVPKESDEFMKLVTGNLVSPDIGTIKGDLQNQKRLAANTLTNASERKIP